MSQIKNWGWAKRPVKANTRQVCQTPYCGCGIKGKKVIKLPKGSWHEHDEKMLRTAKKWKIRLGRSIMKEYDMKEMR